MIFLFHSYRIRALSFFCFPSIFHLYHLVFSFLHAFIFVVSLHVSCRVVISHSLHIEQRSFCISLLHFSFQSIFSVSFSISPTKCSHFSYAISQLHMWGIWSRVNNSEFCGNFIMILNVIKFVLSLLEIWRRKSRWWSIFTFRDTKFSHFFNFLLPM